MNDEVIAEYNTTQPTTLSSYPPTDPLPIGYAHIANFVASVKSGVNPNNNETERYDRYTSVIQIELVCGVNTHIDKCTMMPACMLVKKKKKSPQRTCSLEKEEKNTRTRTTY